MARAALLSFLGGLKAKFSKGQIFVKAAWWLNQLTNLICRIKSLGPPCHNQCFGRIQIKPHFGIVVLEYIPVWSLLQQLFSSWPVNHLTQLPNPVEQVVMCKAQLGLKAWAWARLWGLRLTEISGQALVLGLGLAWAWLGLGQDFARAK